MPIPSSSNTMANMHLISKTESTESTMCVDDDHHAKDSSIFQSPPRRHHQRMGSNPQDVFATPPPTAPTRTPPRGGSIFSSSPRTPLANEQADRLLTIRRCNAFDEGM
mmetsp:Transcript_4426/g.9474  ORF Transcript_4426/g.9474 Transcript_4426/m.9474 type:complete len:108 (-) Transcript_4426:282-605(-)